MTLVREIADAVGLLGDVIRNTREVVEAVNDGRAFLESKHPEVTEDFAELLGQMQLAVEGLAEVTGVISGFRFEFSAGRRRRRGRPVHHLVEDRKVVVTKLRGRLRELKADCERVHQLRDALDARSRSRGWGRCSGCSACAAASAPTSSPAS